MPPKLRSLWQFLRLRKPSQRPLVPTAPSRPRVLFAFVDSRGPFMDREVAGEKFPGPVLSILSAKPFQRLVLFYGSSTIPQTGALQLAVSNRFPDCQLVAHQLPDSALNNRATLIRTLVPLVLAHSGTDIFASVSGCSETIRFAWLALHQSRIIRAKFLEVGTDDQPLFGPAGIRQVQIKPVDATADLARDSNLLHRAQLGAAIRDIRDPFPGFPLPRADDPEDPLVPAGIPAQPQEWATETGSPRHFDFGSSSFREEDSLASTGRSQDSARSPDFTLDDALLELNLHVGSASLRYAAEQAAIAAESLLPILLTGETGTGKERFAHLIHRLSPRASRQLVPVNCAAIPESLAETYLFGHTKGAFSGANADKPGLFESSDDSTLFLDEIAELSLDIQAKLLRVIQDGVVQRIGSPRSRRVDVRIVAATNRELKREVAEGRFREDLYFRLEVVQIRLPALRDRRAEIPELALTLLKQINQRRQRPRQLSKDALRRLEAFHWPGNVRQLSNVLERSVLYARSDVLEPADLLITNEVAHPDPLTALPEPESGFSIETFLTDAREQLFLRALAKCNNNQADAAALLGVSKQAVQKFVASRKSQSASAGSDNLG